MVQYFVVVVLFVVI